MCCKIERTGEVWVSTGLKQKLHNHRVSLLSCKTLKKEKKRGGYKGKCVSLYLSLCTNGVSAFGGAVSAFRFAFARRRKLRMAMRF